MYKVFYNNSAIYIGEKSTNIDSGFLLVQLTNKKDTIQFITNYLKQEHRPNIWLSGYSSKYLFEDVKTCFDFIEAAGGLVKNDEREFLFIKRFGIWDLPKGKMKKSESSEIAAIREVQEETGIDEISILKELTATYHIYQQKNSFVLKKTYWFLMATTSRCHLIPQEEEDIMEAVWLDGEDSRIAIQASYRSLSENFLAFFQD